MGLSIAEKEIPDLILLDVMMPGMDGGAIAQNLLENPRTKKYTHNISNRYYYPRRGDQR